MRQRSSCLCFPALQSAQNKISCSSTHHCAFFYCYASLLFLCSVDQVFFDICWPDHRECHKSCRKTHSWCCGTYFSAETHNTSSKTHPGTNLHFCKSPINVQYLCFGPAQLNDHLSMWSLSTEAWEWTLHLIQMCWTKLQLCLPLISSLQTH